MPTELALTNDQAAINGSAHREPISSFSTPGNGYTDERDDMRCASLIQAGFRWSVLMDRDIAGGRPVLRLSRQSHRSAEEYGY